MREVLSKIGNIKMKNKTCKQCKKDFVIGDDDLSFYEKVSPTFADKTFDIPSPTLCPDCRQIRRLVWRNERSLYKRKSDKSGKEMVTVYSPDKSDIKVFSVPEWWADDWDPCDYGRDFDFSKGFFEQFSKLMKAVPLMGLRNTKSENCEFVNYTAESRNCYMSMVVYNDTEDAHYCYWIYNSKNCIDCSFVDHDENCYELNTSNRNYDCRYSLRINNCRNCHFCVDLMGCSDCILCSNLNHKQYWIRNKQYSKEDYEREMQSFNLGSYNEVTKLRKEFDEMSVNKIVKFANLVNCENCEGDDLLECKDVKNCFSCIRHENAKYVLGGSQDSKNVWDSMGGTYEWVLECNHTGWGSNLLFCSGVLFCSNMTYCENCQNSRDCFGSVGLKSKQYCVFNKQYTRDEYEKLTSKIIEHMQKTGEWGEYYPSKLAPFGYNESLAILYFPKTKEEAIAAGFKWQDEEFSPQYDGPVYEPKDDIKDYIKSEEERQKLLAGVIKCEESGRPFKIMPQELAFYLQQGIPVPHKHYEVRFMERFSKRNSRKLNHRQCMCEQSDHGHEGLCKNEFETTYAPDRPEKVYCESCYQKSIT